MKECVGGTTEITMIKNDAYITATEVQPSTEDERNWELKVTTKPIIVEERYYDRMYEQIIVEEKDYDSIKLTK